MDITSESSFPLPYCADIATYNAATINGSYCLNFYLGVTTTYEGHGVPGSYYLNRDNSAEQSKLICPTECWKTQHSMSGWHRTVHIS